MPSKYSKPVGSQFAQTYVSQHVPVPMEQLMKAMSYKQGIQDQQAGTVDQATDALFSFKGASSADNKYLAELNTNVGQIAEQLKATDLTTYEADDKVKGLVKGLARDPALITIRANRAKYDKFIENRSKLIAAGKDVPDENLFGFMQALNEYERSGGYKSGKVLPEPDIKEGLNIRAKQETFFDNMPKSGGDSLKSVGDVYYNDGWTGITKLGATNRAKQAIESYMTTPEAQQVGRRYDMLKAQGGLEGISKQEYIFKDFLDAGLERVGGISTSGRAAALNKQKENETYTALTQETPSVFLNGREVEYDEKGMILGEGKKGGFLSQIWNAPSGQGWAAAKNYFKGTNEFSDDEERDLGHIRLAGSMNKMTDKQIADRLDKTTHIKYGTFSAARADKETKNFYNDGAGNYRGMPMMDLTTGKRGLNFKDAVEMMADAEGIDLSDDPIEYRKQLKALGLRVVGETKPSYFTPKGLAVSIGNHTFVADLTYGGKLLDNVTQDDIDDALLDKVEKFGAATVERNGKMVSYWKDFNDKGKIKTVK